MENRFNLYESDDSLSISLEKLLAKMRESGSYLELSVKDVRPCLESLLAEAATDEETSRIVVCDLVARLTSAEKQLSEALCLVQDAVSSVSTGCKFYKENLPELQEVG